jgi:pyrimidine operon attenuation protein/uracil phosphoribosyltransferase
MSTHEVKNTTGKRVVLDAAQIEAALEAMADAIAGNANDGPWAVVGIRRGGENLAARLAAKMQKRTGKAPPVGMVDITLYRDDGFGPNDWPEIGPTHIGFDLKAHTVVLVDDVLYTGRTVRAAIDALLDYGRPRALRLAVLVDRGLRELPIRGDAVGLTIQTEPREHVDCVVHPTASPEDAVFLGLREERS